MSSYPQDPGTAPQHGGPGTMAPPPPGYPAAPPQGYPQPHQGQQGPGIGERASQAAEAFGRHVKTPETKEFFKTSEFLVWGLTVLGILIAGAVINGAGDNFLGDEVWRYVAIVSAAYIVSRGISKAGTRRGYGDAPMDRGGFDGRNGGY